MLRRSPVFATPNPFLFNTTTSGCRRTATFYRSSLAAAAVLPLSSTSTITILPTQTSSRRFFSDKDLGIDPETVSNRKVLGYLLPRLWPHDDPKIKFRVLAAISLVFLSKLFHIAVPFYFKGIVDGLHAAGAASGVVTGTLTSVNAVMGGAASVGSTTALSLAVSTVGTSISAFVIAYGICRALSILSTEARWAVFAKVSSNAYSDSYQTLFQKFHRLDYKFHTAKQTGGLMRNIDRGSRAFESLSYVSIFVLIPTIFESVLVCYLLQQQVGAVFALTAVGAVVAYIGWTQIMTTYRAKIRDEFNKTETKANAVLHDGMLNVECVKLFNAEEFERRRIAETVKAQQEQQIKLDKTMALLNFGQQLAFIIAAGANFHLASAGVLAGAMTVGDLVLVDSLFIMLYTPLSMLGIWFREFSSAVVNVKTAVSMLDAVPSIRDAPDATDMLIPSPSNGEIEFKNVTYSFHEGKTVLNDVSLKIPGGSFVGFCGPSGSGKSTILRLVFRFFDVDKGEVLIDGQDVKKVTLDSLRRRFAVIPQDTMLFNESLKYNIGYGRVGTSSHKTENDFVVTEQEVIAATKQAHLYDTIMKFPKGFDTIVGEAGARLSGGEKQRVSIARALLKKDADIVLADEATSALDSVTEAEVVKKLRVSTSSMTKKRTFICVAHRLSTIKDCDIIFVLDGNGKLAEQGTHDDLVVKPDGLYAKLWAKQQKQQKDGGDDSKEEEKEVEEEK